MGAKCCASEAPDNPEVSKGPNDRPEKEELVQQFAPLSGGKEEKKETPKTESKKNGTSPQKFTINIKKVIGLRLGVDVDLGDGQTLLIDKVNPGLVDEWNKANPSQKVEKNDRIISVNRTTGNAQALTEVCKNADDLEMEILKGTQ